MVARVVGRSLIIAGVLVHVAEAATNIVVGTLPKERDGWSLTGPGNNADGPPQLAEFIINPSNFGPGGTVADFTFSIAEISTITPQTLAGLDVFHITFDEQGWPNGGPSFTPGGNVPSLSVSEINAFVDFVNSGGVLMTFVSWRPAFTNPAADPLLTEFGLHTGVQLAGGTATPTAAMPSSVQNGPFGTVNEVTWSSNYHSSMDIDVLAAAEVWLTAGSHNELVEVSHGNGALLAFGDYYWTYTDIVEHAHPSTGFDTLMGNTMTYAATVPEPTTLAILGLGGVAILRRRRHGAL